MFLIISFPQATRKPEDQQVSVLSSTQTSTGRVSICLLIFYGVSEQMYLDQIRLAFSDNKKLLLFFFLFLPSGKWWRLFFIVEIFQKSKRKREKEGRGKPQYFFTMSVSFKLKSILSRVWRLLYLWLHLPPSTLHCRWDLTSFIKEHVEMLKKNPEILKSFALKIQIWIYKSIHIKDTRILPPLYLQLCYCWNRFYSSVSQPGYVGCSPGWDIQQHLHQ